jgi:GcrA cell cycle regulator
MLQFVQVRFWTEARLERCKQLWIEGKSSGEIGRELGTTRNAVISQVHRHGWSSLAPKKAGRMIAEKIMAGRAHRNERRRAHRKPANKVLQIMAEVPAAPGAASQSFADGGPKTFMELGDSDCRFVLGDADEYCAAVSAPGFHFCPQHIRIVYQPK